jgi:hypothetical protein
MRGEFLDLVKLLIAFLDELIALLIPAVMLFVAELAEGIEAVEFAIEVVRLSTILGSEGAPGPILIKKLMTMKKAKRIMIQGANAISPSCHVLSLYSEENI